MVVLVVLVVVLVVVVVVVVEACKHEVGVPRKGVFFPNKFTRCVDVFLLYSFCSKIQALNLRTGLVIPRCIQAPNHLFGSVRDSRPHRVI